MNYPKRVTIELTNKCNRHCTGCPRSKMHYPQGFMKPLLYRKIVDELPKETVVVPFYRGESTLHPSFAVYMSELHRFREVQLATNADYLTAQNKSAILNNCSFISISLHSCKLPYQCKFIEFLHDAHALGLETQVSIVESMLPRNRLNLFKRQWTQIVDRVRIYMEHSVGGFGSMNLHSQPVQCNKPFEDMVIYWDGKVGLCNHDWNNAVALGDLNKQTIREVYNSEAYHNVRALHRVGLRQQVKTCVNCDFIPNKVYGEIAR